MSQEDRPGEAPTISVKLRTDAMTDTMIVDKAKGLNILLVAIPMTTPKLTALGFLWSVLDNMTTFYKAAEAQHAKRSGIIRPGLSAAASLGNRLMGR